MKIIILIVMCYLLCRFIKPIWKAFSIGIVSYILISFIIMTVTVPPDAKLNITGKSLTYFAGDALGRFFLYFTIGFVIFLIFNKSKKTDREIVEREIVESSTTNETNDTLPN